MLMSRLLLVFAVFIFGFVDTIFADCLASPTNSDLSSNDCICSDGWYANDCSVYFATNTILSGPFVPGLPIVIAPYITALTEPFDKFPGGCSIEFNHLSYSYNVTFSSSDTPILPISTPPGVYNASIACFSTNPFTINQTVNIFPISCPSDSTCYAGGVTGCVATTGACICDSDNGWFGSSCQSQLQPPQIASGTIPRDSVPLAQFETITFDIVTASSFSPDSSSYLYIVDVTDGAPPVSLSALSGASVFSQVISGSSISITAEDWASVDYNTQRSYRFFTSWSNGNSVASTSERTVLSAVQSFFSPLLGPQDTMSFTVYPDICIAPTPNCHPQGTLSCTHNSCLCNTGWSGLHCDYKIALDSQLVAVDPDTATISLAVSFGTLNTDKQLYLRINTVDSLTGAISADAPLATDRDVLPQLVTFTTNSSWLASYSSFYVFLSDNVTDATSITLSKTSVVDFFNQLGIVQKQQAGCSLQTGAVASVDLAAFYAWIFDQTLSPAWCVCNSGYGGAQCEFYLSSAPSTTTLYPGQSFDVIMQYQPLDGTTYLSKLGYTLTSLSGNELSGGDPVVISGVSASTGLPLRFVLPSDISDLELSSDSVQSAVTLTWWFQIGIYNNQIPCKAMASQTLSLGLAPVASTACVASQTASAPSDGTGNTICVCKPTFFGSTCQYHYTVAFTGASTVLWQSISSHSIASSLATVSISFDCNGLVSCTLSATDSVQVSFSLADSSSTCLILTGCSFNVSSEVTQNELSWIVLSSSSAQPQTNSTFTVIPTSSSITDLLTLLSSEFPAIPAFEECEYQNLATPTIAPSSLLPGLFATSVRDTYLNPPYTFPQVCSCATNSGYYGRFCELTYVWAASYNVTSSPFTPYGSDYDTFLNQTKYYAIVESSRLPATAVTTIDPLLFSYEGGTVSNALSAVAGATTYGNFSFQALTPYTWFVDFSHASIVTWSQLSILYFIPSKFPNRDLHLAVVSDAAYISAIQDEPSSQHPFAPSPRPSLLCAQGTRFMLEVDQIPLQCQCSGTTFGQYCQYNLAFEFDSDASSTTLYANTDLAMLVSMVMPGNTLSTEIFTISITAPATSSLPALQIDGTFSVSFVSENVANGTYSEYGIFSIPSLSELGLSTTTTWSDVTVTIQSLSSSLPVTYAADSSNQLSFAQSGFSFVLSYDCLNGAATSSAVIGCRGATNTYSCSDSLPYFGPTCDSFFAIVSTGAAVPQKLFSGSPVFYVWTNTFDIVLSNGTILTDNDVSMHINGQTATVSTDLSTLLLAYGEYSGQLLLPSSKAVSNFSIIWIDPWTYAQQTLGFDSSVLCLQNYTVSMNVSVLLTNDDSSPLCTCQPQAFGTFCQYTVFVAALNPDTTFDITPIALNEVTSDPISGWVLRLTCANVGSTTLSFADTVTAVTINVNDAFPQLASVSSNVDVGCTLTASKSNVMSTYQQPLSIVSPSTSCAYIENYFGLDYAQTCRSTTSGTCNITAASSAVIQNTVATTPMCDCYAPYFGLHCEWKLSLSTVSVAEPTSDQDSPTLAITLIRVNSSDDVSTIPDTVYIQWYLPDDNSQQQLITSTNASITSTSFTIAVPTTFFNAAKADGTGSFTISTDNGITYSSPFPFTFTILKDPTCIANAGCSSINTQQCNSTATLVCTCIDGAYGAFCEVQATLSFNKEVIETSFTQYTTGVIAVYMGATLTLTTSFASDINIPTGPINLTLSVPSAQHAYPIVSGTNIIPLESSVLNIERNYELFIFTPLGNASLGGQTLLIQTPLEHINLLAQNTFASNDLIAPCSSLASSASPEAFYAYQQQDFTDISTLEIPNYCTCIASTSTLFTLGPWCNIQVGLSPVLLLEDTYYNSRSTISVKITNITSSDYTWTNPWYSALTFAAIQVQTPTVPSTNLTLILSGDDNDAISFDIDWFQSNLLINDTDFAAYSFSLELSFSTVASISVPILLQTDCRAARYVDAPLWCTSSGTSSCSLSIDMISSCTCQDGFFGPECSFEMSHGVSSATAVPVHITDTINSFPAYETLFVSLSNEFEANATFIDLRIYINNTLVTSLDAPSSIFHASLLVNDTFSTTKFSSSVSQLTFSVRLEMFDKLGNSNTAGTTFMISAYPALSAQFTLGDYGSAPLTVTWNQTDPTLSQVQLAISLFSPDENSSDGSLILVAALACNYTDSSTDNSYSLAYSLPYATAQNVMCELPLIIPSQSILVSIAPFDANLITDWASHQYRYFSSESFSPTSVSSCLSDIASLSDLPAFTTTMQCRNAIMSNDASSFDATALAAVIQENVSQQEQQIAAGTITTPQCRTTCPPLMVIDSTCLQCVCASTECSERTMIAQVYLDNFAAIPDAVIDSMSQEYFFHLAELHLTRQLRLVRGPADVLLEETEALFQNDALYTAPVGIETVTVLGMTQVLNISAWNQFFVYISIAPFPGETLPPADDIALRFSTLQERFYTYMLLNSTSFTPASFSLVSPVIDPNTPSAWVQQWFVPELPSDIDLVSQSFYNISDSSDFITVNCLATQCSASSNALCGALAECPTPEYALLDPSSFDLSIYWSGCPAFTTQYNSTLYPTCTDLYGSSSISPQPWCVQQFVPNYPAVTSVSCYQPSYVTLKDLQIVNNVQSVPAGGSLDVSWDFSGPANYTISILLIGVTSSHPSSFATLQQHQQEQRNELLDLSNGVDLLAIDPYVQATTSTGTWPSYYSILLGTFYALSNGARVTIPTAIDPISAGARLYIQIPQNATIHGNITTSLTITPSQACQSVTCVDSVHAQCNDITGACECDSGYTFPSGTTNTSAAMCQLSCWGQCFGGNDECQLASNGTAYCHCPTSWSGSLCQINDLCPQSTCHSNGYIAWDNETNSCSDDCTCNDNWVTPQTNNELDMSQQCTYCTLDDYCLPIGTNSTATHINCSSCQCLIGYSGSECQYRTLYGTIIFGYNTTTSSSSTITHSGRPTNTTKTITNAYTNAITVLDSFTRSILIRDMALSLFIDSSKVSISRILQYNLNYIQTNYSTTTGDHQWTETVYNMTTQQTNITFAVAADVSISSTSTFIDGENFIEYFETLSSSSSSSFTPLLATVPTSIDNLYSAWNNVQSNLPSTPIGNSDATNDVGSAQGSSAAYDPVCTPSATVTCPSGSDPFSTTPATPTSPGSSSDEFNPSSGHKTNSTTIIIVVVVVVVCGSAAVIGFLILLCVLNKKQVLCFAPSDPNRHKNDWDDPMTDFVTQASNGTHRNSTDASIVGSKSGGSSRRLTATSENSVATKSNDAIEMSNASSRSHSSSIDLLPVEHDEQLPEGWTKMRHPTTDEVFYVNKETMQSQRHVPGEQGSLW